MKKQRVQRCIRNARSGLPIGLVIGIACFISGTRLIAQNPTVAARPSADASADELLARRVTIHVKNVSLNRAIDSLSRVAKVFVEFQLPLLQAYRNPVTLDVTNVPLGAVLEQVLSGTTLRVAPGSQGSLTIVPTDVSVTDFMKSTGIVSGRIVDSASGRGLSGATVKLVGTKLGAVTSDSGRFVLRDVPVGKYVLTVKLFSYRPAEQQVTVVAGERNNLRIALASAPNILAGVVTTATGQQRRIEVGSDITVLNADSVLRVAPVTTVTQLLANRVPGLVVQNTTGIPGAPSRLRLRGEHSIMTSDDPIVIVDGVRVYADQSGSQGNAQLPGTLQSGGGSSVATNDANVTYAGPSALDQIDVNSIETVEVFKGPSASAMYGSDAANGVIVITTKKGRVGSPQWTASVNQGWTTLPGDWPDNYYRFGSPFNGGASKICDVSTALPGQCGLDSVVKFQALNDPTSSPFGTGVTQGANVHVSGGSGSLTYSLTGSVGNQTGYLHLPEMITQQFELIHGFPAPKWMTNPDRYTTWGGTGNLGVQLGRNGANLQFTHSMLQSHQQQSSLQSAIGTLGSTYFTPVQLAQPSFATAFYQQVILRTGKQRAILQTATTTDVLALNQWAPWSWLPIHATVGLNTNNTDNNAVTPRNYVIETGDSVGRYSLSQGTNQVETFDAGTNLVQRYIRTDLGLNVTRTGLNNLAVSTADLPSGVLTPTTFTCATGNFTTCTSGYQSEFNTTTYGWYVAPTFNLFSRLFASPGIRFDGGNSSGSNNTFNPFPKLNFSYIAVDQDHPRFNNMLTLLRPRLAFGIAGVQPGPAQSLRLYTNQQLAMFYTDSNTVGNAVPIMQIDGLGNTHLHPERSRELEGGVDLGFGNDRARFTLSGYRNTRTDAIMPIPVAPSLGGSLSQFIAINVGTIRNTGLEATLDARLLDTRSASWSVNGNFSSDHNRVMNLNADAAELIQSYAAAGVQNVIRPGYPFGGFWANPIVSYGDANGDGFIQPSEIRLADSAAFLGTADPKYQLNASTTLGLFNGRITVNTALNYENGLTQLNGSADLLTQIYNDPQSTLSQQAAVVAPSLGNGSSDIGRVQTVSTLRWTSLSIGWITPQRVAQWARSSQVVVTLQGSNLGLHSSYTGKDPNVNAYSNGNLTADSGQLPQPRTWSVQVNLR